MANSRVISDNGKSNLIYAKDTPCSFVYFVVEGSVKVSNPKMTGAYINDSPQRKYFWRMLFVRQENTQFNASTIEEKNQNHFHQCGML